MLAEDFVGILEDEDEVIVVADDRNETTDVREYWITSYGIDYDVDGIVRRLKKGTIDFPGYQRSYVWPIKRASRFIESLLLRLPVPGIFLYRAHESHKQMVIDGRQRLETLLRFYEGKFENKDFALTGIRKYFEGLRYVDLTDEQRGKLDDSIIHATIIRQDKPDDGGSSQFAIFERLNTNATPLSAQEIRAAIYDGKFNALLADLNGNPDWRDLYGKVSKRGRDEELILRFLALFCEVEDYDPPMKGFLNRFMNANRNLEKYSKAEMQGLFQNTIATILKKIGMRAFKPSRAVNAAVVDSLMVGIARRLEAKGTIDSHIIERYDNLLLDQRFLKSISTGTSQSENVKMRQLIATEAFADVE